MLKDPLGCVGLFLVVIIIFSAIFAHALIPHDPFKLNVRHRLAPPSTEHFLGTDQLGRDVFSRVLMGSRIALWVALVSISLSGTIGLVMGLLAGYGPPWLDKLLLLFFDSVRSFPTIMFALALVTLLGPSLNTVIVVVVVTSIPVYGRIVRAQTQSLKNNEFILAERAMGAGICRVLFFQPGPQCHRPPSHHRQHGHPRGGHPSRRASAFLGVGVRPPTPSWGSVLHDGYSFIRNTPWLVISGGIPLILTTLGFTFLGESMRDIFDPKLRKEM